MACSCSKTPAEAPKPIVTVNGAVIPGDTISQEAQNYPAGSPAEAWSRAARALVIRELVLQRAGGLALVAEPLIDAEGRSETGDEALARAVIEHDVPLPVADEDACRRYYEQNPDRFRSADIYEAAHVLIAANASDATNFERARAEAKRLHAQIAGGWVTLADAARAHSDCASRLNGGALGQITAGDTTPEFEQALFALEPGELVPAPVASRYGFHIIRLERLIEGQLFPFELVQERIAAYLEHRVRQQAFAHYARVLLADADIHGIDMAAAAQRSVVDPIMQPG